MNNIIFYFFYSFAHQSKFLDGLIIFCAVYLPYIVTISALIFIILYHKSLKEVVLVFLSGVSAWVVSSLLKILIHTGRPFAVISSVHNIFPESGYAFPSGHATFFASIAFAIFFKHKVVGSLFLIFAFIIGIARIASGVHFPIDILVGYLLGFLVAFLFKTI